MSETASQRTARLLNMSNAQLIMHAQDLTKQRDELLAALEDAEAGLVFIGAESLVEVGGFVPTALLALRRVKRAIASVKGGEA